MRFPTRPASENSSSLIVSEDEDGVFVLAFGHVYVVGCHVDLLVGGEQLLVDVLEIPEILHDDYHLLVQL